MKQKIKNLINLKTTSTIFGLLFFVMLAGVMTMQVPKASAADTLLSAVYEDLNGDGQVDNIKLTFDETIDLCTYEAGDWGITTAGTINLSAITGISCTTSDAIINVAVTADANVTGGATDPIITYTDAVTSGSLSGATTAVISAKTATVTDTAKPIFVSASATSDTNIKIILSETIAGGTVTFGAADQWTASGIVSSAVAISGADINLTVDSLGDTAFTASDFAFATASGVIQDSAGNAILAFSGKSITDGQAPTAAILYSDADSIVKSGDSLTITATFNEDMLVSAVPKIVISGSNTVTAIVMTRTDATHYTYVHTVSAGDGIATVALSIGTDLAGNLITSAPTSGATFTVDNTAPTNQDAVFTASASAVGGGSVIIVSSGTDSNAVWFAPSGTTSFLSGATMTTAGGTATTILAPATAGSYKLFVLDAAGNYSTASSETLTVDGVAPTATIAYSSSSVTAGNSLTITANFSEAMAGSPVVQIALSGADTLSATNMTKVTTTSYTYTHTVASGAGTVTVSLSTGTDVAGNVITSAPTSGATFTTSNPGSAAVSPVPISTTGQAAATPAFGGVISKTNSDGTSAKVILPVGALANNAVITIIPQAKGIRFGTSVVGEYVFNFTAVNAAQEKVKTFAKPLEITLSYSEEQIAGKDENNLQINYWNEETESWIAMESVVDAINNKITTNTTHFSYFAITEGDSSSSGMISDGDIIQCQSCSNPNAVYIVKEVAETKYIRHIVSLEIFNYYTHLKWENLKQVDSLDAYSMSGWVRVNTGTNGTAGPNDKVYEINGDQTKHWIDMTAEDFLSHGGSENAIYTVNQGELDLYQTGVAVMSL